MTTQAKSMSIKPTPMMTTKRLFSVSVCLFLFSSYLLTSSTSAQAAGACDVTVDATDAMTFSTKAIEVPKSCKEFTVHLKHTGKLGKNIMGHNLVITKESEQQAVLADGSKAGAASDYVKAKDPRVVAFTKLIGGGETASAKFAVSKLAAADGYAFFCSFPGHAFMMKGVVKLV